MSTLTLTALLFAGSGIAGFLGALTGLGGGVVIVPLLVIAFHVDIHYAIGTSLVAVIATSSGAAAAYVREGYTNLRIGMLLEIATTLGAVGGALLGGVLPATWIAVIFGLFLAFSALNSRARADFPSDASPDRLATRLRLDSTCPTPEGPRQYHVQNVPAGFSIMAVAGMVSGLLGIGSGALKVLAMDGAMRLPFKVSTATSNFMIGVTAAASAGIFLNRGYLQPELAMPVVLGVLAGATLGTHVLMRASSEILRRVFRLVLLALAVEMVYKGLSGKW